MKLPGQDFVEEDDFSQMCPAGGKPLNKRMTLSLESHYIHGNERLASVVESDTPAREIDLQLVCEKCHFPDDFLSCYKVWLWPLQSAGSSPYLSV